MANSPFNDPAVNSRIAAAVLRIQSELLEWNGEPTETDFDTKIVTTLVETLDAHARPYLEMVDSDNLLPEYTNALRRVGSALIQNAEQRSFLEDPFSDDRLCKIAESSGEYIQRKHSLTPEQQEAEIHTAVERIRRDVMQQALRWRSWKNQILVRIETRFEARYRHWTAEAFERVRQSPHSVQETLAPQSTAPVFISYSWDTEEHKSWVLAFAKRLREDGIDAIIDQMHLALGARIPEFMERSVRDSRCVLVICTELYKRRFDSREGGAGYEGNIITGEIVREVGRNKFVPVLRNGDWTRAMPTALSGIYGIDLHDDSPNEYRKLLKHLHGMTDVSPAKPRPEWLDMSPLNQSLRAPFSSTSRRERGEELFALAEEYFDGLVEHYLPYLQVMTGALTYNQALDLTIAQKGVPNIHRIELLIGADFSELKPAFAKVLAARDCANEIIAVHKAAYKRGDADGSRYIQPLQTVLGELARAADQFKHDIMVVIRSA